MRRHVTAVVAVGASTALALVGSLTGVGTASPSGQVHADQGSPAALDLTGDYARGTSSPWLRALAAPARPVGPAPSVHYRHTVVSAANPYVAMVPRPGDVHWKYWQRWLDQQSELRAKADSKTPVVAPILHEEQEPAHSMGSNDTRSNAETLTGFGLGPGQTSAVRVLGSLSPPSPSYRPAKTSEDNGSVSQATRTGINRPGEGIRLSSVIGDGPHGSDGDKSGDFDVFKVSAHQGQRITASSKGSDLRTVLVVYQHLSYGWDYVDVGLKSLNFAVPADGDYYVLVAASNTYLRNILKSGSGTGVGYEGSYKLKLGLSLFDRDFYRVHLRSGDVLGGTIHGRAGDLSVRKPDGTEAMGSHQDASGIYPMDSPLPGGGLATVSYVAEERGWYTVSTREGSGAYDALLELYRPGAESEPTGSTQKIFLDFDGERVNTAPFGGYAVSQLSPLSAFLGRWHLPSRLENQLIDKVVATVEENVRDDLIARGLNDDVRVQVLNSRDNPDAWGRPNVSRVIVGGTIDESSLFTIGISQSIDPGNFEHEDSAIVLLDLLSGPTRNSPFVDVSLNSYITPQSQKVDFIGHALGNVISHEAGHFLGSWHVDQFNPRTNLMDQGGNFPRMFGVGPDGVGGTADDRDVDFGEDTFNPWEGFTGLEDTLNNTAWALRPGLS